MQPSLTASQTWQDRLGQNRLEDSFQEFKPPLSPSESQEEAYRCLNCYDAPCIQACPTQINIPQFIHRIASGNTLGAAKTILNSNILAHSCALVCPTEVLCEGACVYHGLHQRPLSIGKLQRFAVETAYQQEVVFFQPGPSTGKKVALIGAGPASLACAHELRVLGHEAVIFEKEALPGGLNTWGIAPYKMKAALSLKEIENIEKIGVQFKFGHELGKNLDLQDLLSAFDAVFLGIGLGPDRMLDLPGSHHPRVRGAVEFIREIKLQSKEELKWISSIQTAVVVGGGNTALDACRELKGLGVPEVLVCYRKGEEEMSGYAHEFKWARQEGVSFSFWEVPTHFESVSEQEVLVHLQNSEKRLAQLILMATGQSRLESSLQNLSQVDSTGRTSYPRVYQGGDFANGGKEVVNAVAEGKKAAHSIHEDFQNG